MAKLPSGKCVISTGDGTPFHFFILGTVDNRAVVLEGSIVNVTNVEVVGYNTRVTFEVLEISKVPSSWWELIVGKGALGYVDFKNPARHVVPEGSLSVFCECTDLPKLDMRPGVVHQWHPPSSLDNPLCDDE